MVTQPNLEVERSHSGRKSARRPRPARWPALLLLALGILPSAGQSCEHPAAARPAGAADTLLLDRPIDGPTEVRLAGLEVPRDTDGAFAAAVAASALQAVSAALQGRLVCVIADVGGRDRYGRLLAQVYRDDGLWLQGALLEAGLARVQPTPDARARAADMLATERRAREAGLGLWRDAVFRVRTALDVRRTAGGFQIVEGRVLEAERRQDRWYLNFGTDWRSDFTVTIPKQVLTAFGEAAMQPYALKGRLVRVRGWVQSLNGPMIEAMVPEQIETIEETGG